MECVMTRWNLVVSDETDRSVRSYLARTGGEKGDLSKFVDEAVRKAVFHNTVKGIKARNAGKDQDELLTLIDEAVDASRAPGT